MEIMTYEEMKNLIETYSKDCKCVVSIVFNHTFKYEYDYYVDPKHFTRTTTFKPALRSPLYKYQYSHFIFNYFNHDNRLCKTDMKIKFDRILTLKETGVFNRLIKEAKDKSSISDKNTTIINKDHEILNENKPEIVRFINKYGSGTTLDKILEDYLSECNWIVTGADTVDDLLLVSKSQFLFNTYADNPSKDKKVFDYIRLSIPVLKHNMNYDQTVDFIKQHMKEVNNTILKLLHNKMKRRNLPVSILDFKNSKMVLTRQFELVFTVSVKSLPNEEDTN